MKKVLFLKWTVCALFALNLVPFLLGVKEKGEGTLSAYYYAGTWYVTEIRCATSTQSGTAISYGSDCKSGGSLICFANPCPAGSVPTKVLPIK